MRKSCSHSLMNSFLEQVSRLTNAAFSEHVLVKEKKLRLMKQGESAPAKCSASDRP